MRRKKTAHYSSRFTPNDICKRLNISKATLFRWEREGLISNVGRDWRNWRVYSERNLRQIERVMRRKNGRRI
jgi:DNA-binding transcriptional MerR regulator